MTPKIPRLYELLRGTFLHPQWLADRYHSKKRKLLRGVRNCLVLDIGSGKCTLSRELAENNLVFGLDYPATATRYESRCDVFGDVRCLPFRSASVDVALFFEVLEHVAEPFVAVAEISRVLRPGGKIIGSVPFAYPIHDAPFDYWRFSGHGIKEMLDRSSLEVEIMEVHGNSFVSILQMHNLAILELAWMLWKRHPFYLVPLGIPLYLACLLANLMGAILILLPNSNALCLGYSFVARRR
jgi:SAM-dependent methyltransferase